jgi:hypothetical protein
MNPLQDLKDIYTPAAIESWPPAYGWWILLAVLVTCIYLLTKWIVKVRKVRFAKRQALKTLQQIDGSNLDAVSQLNQLLKRVAMTYFPNQNVQQMHGNTWAEFLVKTLPNNKTKDFSESIELMLHTIYQPHTLANTKFNDYKQSVESWIKNALPPNKDVIHKLELDNA